MLHTTIRRGCDTGPCTPTMRQVEPAGRRRAVQAVTRALLLWAMWVAGCAPMAALAAPSPPPAPSGGADTFPPDVRMRIMLVYVNQKPAGVFPIISSEEHPMCPLRLASALDFVVDYVPNAKIATLTGTQGQTAVFKTGVRVALVKTRAGAQRVLVMPVPPRILTSRIRTASDRMWIPLESVVTLGGGRMTAEGRTIRITR